MNTTTIRIYALVIITIFFTISLFALTDVEPPVNFLEENAGTEDNPYQINNLANLKWMSETLEELIGKHYIQTADIDATETEEWTYEYGGIGFRPIGRLDYIVSGDGTEDNSDCIPFSGVYDGNNFTVSNLYLSKTNALIDVHGFFGEIINAVIKNVNLIDVKYTARTTSGILVGKAINSHIINCHVSTPKDYPVRFGGYTDEVWNVDANLIPTLFGSLAGSIYGGIVEQCTANVTINDEPLWSMSNIGGLIGAVNDTSHSGLMPDGELTNTIVRDCSFYGNFFISESFQNYLLAWWKDYWPDKPAPEWVQREYWIHKGGLFAFVDEDATIERCFISTEEAMPRGFGIASTVGGTVTSLKNCLWDVQSTGLEDPFGSVEDSVIQDNVLGLNTSDMKDAGTYISAGFDFETVWDIDPAINNGFPFINLRAPLPLSIPLNLAGSFADDVVSITWDAPVDNGRGVFDSYNVYRDGVLIDNCEVNQYDETGLADGTYTYYITAVYIVKEALEESLPSEIVEITVKVEPTMGNEDHVNLAETKIIGNYPNPFNPTTTISFSLKTSGLVNLEIFNIKGQKVKTLVSGEMTSGPHLVVWNGTDESGHGASSGIYFYRLTADRYSETQKMVLMK